MMRRMKTLVNKSFVVDTKEYVYKNLRMIRKINDQNLVEETKVYQMNAMEIHDDPLKTYRMVLYDRKKLSVVAFPSSKSYDDIIKKRKTVFRVNNKIYVNFEKEFSEKDSNVYHKVYMNFNNNKDTDIKDSIAVLQNILNTLQR